MCQPSRSVTMLSPIITSPSAGFWNGMVCSEFSTLFSSVVLLLWLNSEKTFSSSIVRSLVCLIACSIFYNVSFFWRRAWSETAFSVSIDPVFWRFCFIYQLYYVDAFIWVWNLFLLFVLPRWFCSVSTIFSLQICF